MHTYIYTYIYTYTLRLKDAKLSCEKSAGKGFESTHTVERVVVYGLAK